MTYFSLYSLRQSQLGCFEGQGQVSGNIRLVDRLLLVLSGGSCLVLGLVDDLLLVFARTG